MYMHRRRHHSIGCWAVPYLHTVFFLLPSHGEQNKFTLPSFQFLPSSPFSFLFLPPFPAATTMPTSTHKHFCHDRLPAARTNVAGYYFGSGKTTSNDRRGLPYVASLWPHVLTFLSSFVSPTLILYPANFDSFPPPSSTVLYQGWLLDCVPRTSKPRSPIRRHPLDSPPRPCYPGSCATTIPPECVPAVPRERKTDVTHTRRHLATAQLRWPAAIYYGSTLAYRFRASSAAFPIPTSGPSQMKLSIFRLPLSTALPKCTIDQKDAFLHMWLCYASKFPTIQQVVLSRQSGLPVCRKTLACRARCKHLLQFFDGKVLVVPRAVVPMFHSRVQAPHQMIPKMSRCENPKGHERVSKLPQQSP